ncbi:MAG: orotate phosphoribosyltransferase [Cytophagales bacterium]|nr:orotate phosphoribosyltransferase [Cytophagales bacterium]
MYFQGKKDIVANKMAAMLLDIGAVKLQPHKPFKWASSWNAPIYCDNRLTLSYPEIRNFVKESFISIIKNKYSAIDAVAGVATAGIPQAALIADAMNLPLLYVRSKTKEHGMENLVEGKIINEGKVIVVEDLISTGASSLSAVDALKRTGMQVLGMLAIFTYGFETAEVNFKKKNVPLHCLTNYNYLLSVALERKYIGERDMEILNAWRRNPDKWGNRK